MKKIKISVGIISILLAFGSLQVYAQQTAIHNDPQSIYRTGLELFNKEKYAAAQQQFNDVIHQTGKYSDIRIRAEYYRAICAVELFNEDAEYLLSNFIKDHPGSAKIEKAYFQLGRLQFRDKSYHNALESFLKVSRSVLSRQERIEYNFKLGLCYLQQDEPDKASRLFASVKDNNNKYAGAASYYYGHIAYQDKDFDVALEEFDKVKNSRAFSKLIPYYKLQINYYKGNYDKILEEGPDLFRNANYRRKPEIARIIGDAYYRAGNYEKALEYLEEYKKTARHGMSREDNYQIGFTYYMNEKYKDAIRHFQDVIREKDSLSQNAYYHLADCYLQTDQKKYASNAFLSAYKLDFNEDIKEDALFNYAKLSIEVAHDPYNQSIKSLEQYIDEYPNSQRLEEAYNLMVQLYLSTSNYKAALQSIEKIKNMNTKLKQAYQKITFYRGIELFNNREFKKSINLFKRATNYNYNKEITAEANYWIGEAFYRLENYWGAMKYYNIFARSSAAKNLEIYPKVYYNLGYTYYKRDDYSDAVAHFKKFLNYYDKNLEKLLNDTYLRLGDCYFINKRYKSAIDYYNESLRLNQTDVDYALYQKAMSYGALGEFQSKISTLDRLVKFHGSSPYVDDALYEMATTELILNDNRSALVYFDKLAKQHPNSNLAKKSLLKMGLIYYNNDQYSQAIRTLKQIAEKYPNTSEARDALASLKNIYIDMNKVDDYFAYTRQLGHSGITATEQDSITYIAAENQYMRNDCEDAIPAFKIYLKKFPHGAFAINAHYYKADCEYRRDSLVNALEDYEYVLSGPTTTFTENALLNAARLSYKLKMYENAYKHYKNLEKHAQNNTNINFALEGQMKSSYYINNYANSIEAASKLLRNNKVTSQQVLEAHYILGKSYFEQNNNSGAKQEFAIAGKLATTEIGAESKYYHALLEYEDGNYKEAEKLVFELVETFSSYDYWVAKSFILLADVYVNLENIFQAKQTLQSIIDNYDGPELGNIAKRKLQEITEMENRQESQNQAVDTNEF